MLARVRDLGLVGRRGLTGRLGGPLDKLEDGGATLRTDPGDELLDHVAVIDGDGEHVLRRLRAQAKRTAQQLWIRHWLRLLWVPGRVRHREGWIRSVRGCWRGWWRFRRSQPFRPWQDDFALVVNAGDHSGDLVDQELTRRRRLPVGLHQHPLDRGELLVRPPQG